MREITGADAARMFGLGFIAPTIAGVAGVIGAALMHSTMVAIAGVSIALMVGGWTIWSFFDRGWTFADFGFVSLGRRGWHLLWQIPVMLGFSLIIAAGIGALIQVEPAEQDNRLELVPIEYAPLIIALMGFLAVIAGPIWEEVVFRRFIMGWLDNRFKLPIASILASALLFGLVHMTPPIIVWAFLLGICCAILYRWHGSLWAAILHHGFNNLMVTIGMAISLYSS